MALVLQTISFRSLDKAYRAGSLKQKNVPRPFPEGPAHTDLYGDLLHGRSALSIPNHANDDSPVVPTPAWSVSISPQTGSKKYKSILAVAFRNKREEDVR